MRNYAPIAFLVLLLAVGAACRAETITPPQGGENVIAFSQEKSPRLQSRTVKTASSWVAIENKPFSHAFQAKFSFRPKTARDAQLIIPVNKTFSKESTMLLSFWVRSSDATSKSGIATVSVQAGAEQRANYKFAVTNKWRQWVRPFKSSGDCGPANGKIYFHLGVSKSVQIADVQLLDYGPDVEVATLPRSTISYEGRAPDAQWRKDALARIEKIRKGMLAIKVTDSSGNAVSDAKVRIDMQRHAFGFGTAVSADFFTDPKSYPVKRHKQEAIQWQDAKQYREIVKRCFNRVTFGSELRPQKWQYLTGDQPYWKRKYQELTQQTVPWLQKNRIAVRGHYIGWAPMDYTAIEKKFVGNPEGHRQWLWQHMADILPKTSSFVSEWDTINHIIGWGKHTYEKEYGGPQIYADLMKEARRLAPKATHTINEGKVLPNGYKREAYKRIIRFLNERGQAPDVVGFMAHFDSSTLTPPTELLEVYDSFAKVVPRLQLTEFDVDVGSDEGLQADYYRDVMIASFSHPNLVSIVQWGFWEKDHWKPTAALWRSDWSLKPVGEVFVDQITNQWWTTEIATTDENGQCQVPGFLGEYLLTVEKDGNTTTAKTTLPREGRRLQIRIESP